MLIHDSIPRKLVYSGYYNSSQFELKANMGRRSFGGGVEEEDDKLMKL